MPVKIGKYEVIEEIGRGSMGTEFAAYDPFADTNVAIKLVHSELLKQEDNRGKFVRFFLTRPTPLACSTILIFCEYLMPISRMTITTW